MGAVAGIVVGVLVFVTLAVVGAVLAIILTWYFKYRHTRHFMKMASDYKGIGNPNYGDVDRGLLITQNQTIAVASDYEVPLSMSHSDPRQQLHVQQPGHIPTQKYINIPNRNPTTSLTESSDEGEYSYVIIRHPHHQAARPQRSYDSHFLQSTESWDLPTLAAAETGDPASGKVTSNTHC